MCKRKSADRVGYHWQTGKIDLLDVSSEEGRTQVISYRCQNRELNSVCFEHLMPLHIDFLQTKRIHFAAHDSHRLGHIRWEAMSHLLLIDAGTAAPALQLHKLNMPHKNLMNPKWCVMIKTHSLLKSHCSHSGFTRWPLMHYAMKVNS